MIRRISRIRSGQDDAGFGMIMVIGLMTVMLVLVTVIMGVVNNSLKGSTRHDNYDDALTSAESGIDQTLARLQRAYVVYGQDYQVPTPSGESVDTNPVCSGTPPTAPASFASETAERDWAKQKIAAEIAANPSCIQHASGGDYAILKPASRQTVYAEGWSPSYGASNAKTRLIKAEYLFAPYAPTDAILTGCNLELDSSTTVTTVTGSDPTLAAVHSNCAITTQGNPTVTGPVSSTGVSTASSNNFTDNTSGKVTNTPAENVPTVTALEVYKANYNQYSNWYDMCPDGTVRPPSANGPCDPTTTPYATLTSGVGNYNGFQYEGEDSNGIATWDLINGASNGVYYFDDANEQEGTGLGNPSSGSVTIIASSKDTTTCPKLGGNIDWNHDDLGSPAITNLFMFADADLSTESNFHAGSASSGGAGEFIAGDQVSMQTSSQGAYGSVIAEDTCQNSGPVTSDVVKNPAIYYDPNAQAPFTNIIDTTLWLEMPG